MNKLVLFGILGVVVVVLIIIAIIASNSYKKKKRLDELDKIQDRISMLKSLPVQYLLNKVSLMPKTAEVEKQYEEWNETYEYLSTHESVRLKGEVNEVESLVYARKYKETDQKLVQLEKDIEDFEQQYQTIQEQLSVATQVDVKNREEITNQKELFRNYRKMYQANIESYKPYNQAIEKYFVNIEDSFTNIDILLNQSQVDKARSKATSLEGELLKMKDILNNLPAVLDDLTQDLPIKLKEVETTYNDIMKRKYNLEHLNVPKRFNAINKNIVSVLSKNVDVFLKDLQDTSHLVHKDLDNILIELEQEIQANEKLDNSIGRLVDVSMEADKLCKEANTEIDGLKKHYILSQNEEANLIMETRLVFNFLQQKNEIVSKHMSTAYVASQLQEEAEVIIPKFEALSKALKAYLVRIEEIRTDEKRIQNEYNNMLYIIKDCESRLRQMQLPMLSQAYYDTIEECKIGLKEVSILLNEKPLNITLISSKASFVSEAVYKLYDNSRNLLKTAQMAENTIVFANRYRSSRPEIDVMLNRAEQFFTNGEYTKSLSSAIEAIESIYPSIRKELLRYKSKQLSSTPI
ncbi:MAG: septation ring formation regulator EzrA [Erysipelotrichales bacterium]